MEVTDFLDFSFLFLKGVFYGRTWRQQWNEQKVLWNGPFLYLESQSSPSDYMIDKMRIPMD